MIKLLILVNKVMGMDINRKIKKLLDFINPNRYLYCQNLPKNQLVTLYFLLPLSKPYFHLFYYSPQHFQSLTRYLVHF